MELELLDIQILQFFFALYTKFQKYWLYGSILKNFLKTVRFCDSVRP